MNIPMIIAQVILYSVLLGLCLWGIKHGVSLYVFSRKKETINKLNARISILKLHLKGKIKRKCNKIADVFTKEDPETLHMIQPKLNKIATLSFSTAADYQNLVSTLSAITQDISNYIKIKHKALLKQQEAQAKAAKTEDEPKEAPTEADKIAENCKKLVKYDKAHMLIVVEIIQATEQLIERTNEFNALVEYEKNQKKITEIPEKIEIENYEIIAELVEQAKTSNIESPDFQILGKGPSAEDAA